MTGSNGTASGLATAELILAIPFVMPLSFMDVMLLPLTPQMLLYRTSSSGSFHGLT